MYALVGLMGQAFGAVERGVRGAHAQGLSRQALTAPYATPARRRVRDVFRIWTHRSRSLTPSHESRGVTVGSRAWLRAEKP